MSDSFVNHEKWAASFGSSQDKIVYRKQIGKGSYGEVWSAEWNRKEVAAKRIHGEFFRREYTQEITDHYIGEFRKEWEILRKLDHPNIVKMHTVLFPPNESPVIVMELMHCDLLNYIEKSMSTPKVSPIKGLSIALGVAEGLEYLHGLTPPVVHRDLATKNILLTVDGQPKIADLGVAKVFAAGKDDFATVGPGTPVYSAPETYLNVRDDRAKYGVKVDIFSFGVVLLVINVGHEPVVFPPKPILKDGSKIPEIKRRENDIKQLKDDRLKKVILDCLQDESSFRPHSHEIVTELRAIKNPKALAKCEPDIHFERISPPNVHDYSFKVVFLGSCGVGKTCLLELLGDPTFDFTSSISTIGVSTVSYSYRYMSCSIHMNLSDTAGQEKHISIPPIYLRRADGVFLVYDVSAHETFEMLPFWIEMVREFTPKNCQVLLVGNKVDLRNTNTDKPKVPQKKALAFANDLEIPYVETSAKDIDSIINMFQKMIDILMSTVNVKVDDVHLQERETAKASTHSSFPPEQEKKKRSSGCCVLI